MLLDEDGVMIAILLQAVVRNFSHLTMTVGTQGGWVDGTDHLPRFKDALMLIFDPGAPELGILLFTTKWGGGEAGVLLEGDLSRYIGG